MTTTKPITAKQIERITVDLEQWINRMEPSFKRICSKETGETPLEVAALKVVDCAWHLRGMLHRIHEELARQEAT
jgi:hypothetical protein